MGQEFLNPKQILKERLRLEKNMIAADFGCGSGGWAIPLAEILEEGKVYAIDLLDEPLSAVRSRARIKNLKNIEIVKADIEKTISRLLASSLHLILMTNLLFQVNDKKSIIKEARRVLKPGGKILVVDWNEAAESGPENKISIAAVKELAQKENFKPVSEFLAGDYHYGLILEKTA